MMNLKQILCPIDFSDSSQAVNEYASLLAQATGARLIYLHVAFSEVPYSSAHAYVNVDLETDRVQRQLEETMPTVEGVAASYVVECGPPTDRIVEYATKTQIDSIVMGTHGHAGLKRVLLGSVAESVVRKAACPVLALKAKSVIPVE